MFEWTTIELTGDLILQLTLAIVAGILLGAFYYGGLWWTVRRVQTAKSPGLLFGASFIIRTFIVIGGFWLVTQGDWPLILVCLAAFIGVRMVMTRRWGPAGIRHMQVGETDHGTDA
jgi:F1F0 ATPase subunit 2